MRAKCGVGVVLAIFFVWDPVFCRGEEGEISLVSRVAARTGVGISHWASVDASGRWVVFEWLPPQSRAGEAVRQVYLADRMEGDVRAVSCGEGGRSHGGPAVSGDGRWIAFHSYPTAVVLGQAPRRSDLFVFDRTSEACVQVTLDASDDGEALFPALSREGSFLVFSTNARRIAGEETGGFRQVVLLDRQKGEMQLISRARDGAAGDAPSGYPRISGDGRYVAFLSGAGNLTRGTPQSVLSTHLYLMDRRRSMMIRVDEAQRGFPTEALATGRFAMDGEGRFIVFEGRPRPSGSLDAGRQLEVSDLFLFDRRSGRVTGLLPSAFVGRAEGPAVSADGRFVALSVFPTEEAAPGLVVWDQERKEAVVLLAARVRNALITADGTQVFFEADEALTSGSIGRRNIYSVPNPGALPPGHAPRGGLSPAPPFPIFPMENP